MENFHGEALIFQAEIHIAETARDRYLETARHGLLGDELAEALRTVPSKALALLIRYGLMACQDRQQEVNEWREMVTYAKWMKRPVADTDWMVELDAEIEAANDLEKVLRQVKEQVTLRCGPVRRMETEDAPSWRDPDWRGQFHPAPHDEDKPF